MSQYKKEFPFKVAFPPQPMTNVLAEWLAKKGVKQAHVAGASPFFHFVHLSIVPSSTQAVIFGQKPRNMHTSPFSSMEALRNSSRVKIVT
jgi:hypothetical protein